MEESYYLFSKNKGADQLRSYCATDLRLCFRIYKKPVLNKPQFNRCICMFYLSNLCIWNFKSGASLCSCVSRFVSNLVETEFLEGSLPVILPPVTDSVTFLYGMKP